jgi:hypothetical protein
MTGPSTAVLIQPSPDVTAARQSLDAAVAALDAIAPEYPQGGVTPVWLAYVHQQVRVDHARDDLHRAVRAHYTELTGMPTGTWRNP